MRKLFGKHTALFIIAILALALPFTLSTASRQQSIKQYAATTHQVTIQNYTMNPPTITVNVGDTVTWTNQDVDLHDAHSTTEAFASPLLKQGESWSFTFTQPGTFEYYCTPHKNTMKGYKVIVAGAATATQPQTLAQPTTVSTPIPPTIQLPPPEPRAEAPLMQPSQDSGEDTEVAVTLALHGIGQSGDSINPQANELSNKDPRERDRLVSLILINSAGQTVLEPSGTVTYAPETGDFRGVISLGSKFTPGNYTVKVRMKKYLVKLAATAFTISAGTNTLPAVGLTVGDTNASNTLDSIDYNAIIDCFTEDTSVKACDINSQLRADLNDDGAINLLDLNLFLREAQVGKGD